MYEEKCLIRIIKYLLNSDTKDIQPPILEKELNWDRLIGIAKRHRVDNLLYYAMPGIPDADRPSADVQAALQKKAMRAAAVDLKQRSEKERLMRRFEAEHLFCMPVKGSDIKDYYPKSEWRTMTDLDFLYKAEQHREVKQLLLDAGYAGYRSGLKHDCYFKKPFIELEMHRLLVAAGTTAEAYYSDVWEKAHPREGCRFVYQLGLDEQYIYTMVHLAEHFKNGGVGIRFIMDLFVFSGLEGINRPYVDETFQKLGIARFAAYVEQLAQNWFGREDADTACGDAEFLEELGSFIIENGVYGQAGHARDTAMARDGRGGYVRRMVFPEYSGMVSLYPWLEGRKYLLPAAWAGRLFRTVLFRKDSIRLGMSTLRSGSSRRGKDLMEFYQKCGLPGHSDADEERAGEETPDKIILDFLQILRYEIRPSGAAAPDLTEPVDWKALGALAKKHHLFPMFHDAACRFSDYKAAPDYEENVNYVMSVVGQQVKKTEEFLELYRKFLKEDLRPIVMKGLICRQLYGKNAEKRPSSDEDILVRKEDFFKVRQIMEAKGYVCRKPDVTQEELEQLQDVGFYEPKLNFLIEVHTNIMGHTNQMRTKMGACFDDVFEHTRTVGIRGVPVATMSHTHHFLFLALHAFKHFTLSGVGMRQMLDVLLYQETYEKEIAWETVRAELEENHAAGYLGDLQFIGERYLGFSFGVTFEPLCPIGLLEDMAEAGVFGKQGEADILAARINLNTMGRRQGKVASLFRMGFPPISYMLTDVPYLKEKPWMLPVEWAKRWGRFFRRSGVHGRDLMMDGMKKSQKRMELLKKYGL